MSAYGSKVESLGAIGYWPMQEEAGVAALENLLSTGDASIGSGVTTGSSAPWAELKKAAIFSSGHARILDGVAGGHAFTSLGANAYWVAFLFNLPVTNETGGASGWWQDNTVAELRREAGSASAYDVVFSLGFTGNKLAIGRSIAGASSQAVSEKMVADGEWHLALFQVGTDTVSIYLDNEPPELLSLASGGVTMGDNQANFALGGRQRDNGTIDSQHFNGGLLGFAVGEGSLSDGDVANLYKLADQGPVSTSQSLVSGVVKVDGTPSERKVRAFGYEDTFQTIDGSAVSFSKSLGHAISDPETGEYTINLLGGYSKSIFVVAFDDYGKEFVADMVVDLGDRVHPSTPGGYVMECTGSGTLPAEEPQWSFDTETSSLYGTATMIARPFFRPMVHGPIMPNVIQQNISVNTGYIGDIADTNGDVWSVYKIESSGTVIVAGTGKIQIVAVGGGGAGSTFGGGAGGGGGVIAGEFDVIEGEYTITVGAGGLGPPSSGKGSPGEQTVVVDPSGAEILKATGGMPGEQGSGGQRGGHSGEGYLEGTLVNGSNLGIDISSAGGSGGGAGSDGFTDQGGDGLLIEHYEFESYRYGAGGGPGPQSSGGYQGGIDGGGDGKPTESTGNEQPGDSFSGGGGGGSWSGGAGDGHGGSGVVLIRHISAGESEPPAGDMSAQYWRILINDTLDADEAYKAMLGALEFWETDTDRLPTDAGTPIFSTETTDFEAFRVFNDTPNQSWLAEVSQPLPQWIGYQFQNPEKVTKVVMQATSTNGNKRSPKDFEVQKSDDGVTWETVATFLDEPQWASSEVRTFSLV